MKSLPEEYFWTFEKEFNTVNCEILISKIEHYGVRSVPLTLLKSYLENWKQFVDEQGYQYQVSKLKWYTQPRSLMMYRVG